MRRAGAGLAVTAVVAALVFGGPLLARGLVVQAQPSSGEAVMVLSGSAVQAERLDGAVALVRQGRARTLILTDDGVRGGWSRARQARLMMVEHAQEKLAQAGVSSEQIVQLPGIVRSTYDEARALRNYTDQHPLRAVVIMTSTYHSRRALWVFRRVFQGAATQIGMEPAPPGEQSPSPLWWWMTGRGWRQVGAEYPKLAYYYVRY